MRIMFTLMLVVASFVAQAFPAQYGYAEMFISLNQMNEPGVYSIRIDDQVITNANGKFRFFDLNPGVKEVYIQRNGYNLYKGIISVYNGTRTVVDFRGLKGLQIVQQVALLQNNNQADQSYWYGWNYNQYNNQNQWPNNNNNYPNNQWPNNNNPNNNPNNPNQWPNNNQNNNNMPVGMDANSFSQFKQTVKNQSFDSNKVTLIKNTAKNARFTSQQVSDLLAELTFDSNRLDVAKYCYDFVVDKNNYFKTYDKFQFDSSVKELSNYISTRN